MPESLRCASPRTRALFTGTGALELLPSLKAQPEMLSDVLAAASELAHEDIELVSPAAAGRTSQELEALFAADQKVSEEVWEGEDEDYCHTLSLQGRLDNRNGVRVVDTSLDGCLVAMHDSQPVGFVKFAMALTNEIGYVDLRSAQEARQEATELNLDVELDVIYVCLRHRGLAIGSAMLHAIGYLYDDVLRDLDGQLQPLGQKHRCRFKLNPALSAQLTSESGAGAADSLLRVLEAVDDDMRVEKSLARLTVRPWDTEGVSF